MSINLLADVAPPPPNLPLVGGTIPHPMMVIVLGCCFAAAFWMLGRMLAGNKGQPAWSIIAVLVIATLTLASAAWTSAQWSAYAEVERNSHGPVQEEPDYPLDDGVNEIAAHEDAPDQPGNG